MKLKNLAYATFVAATAAAFVIGSAVPSEAAKKKKAAAPAPQRSASCMFTAPRPGLRHQGQGKSSPIATLAGRATMAPW